MYLLKAAKKRPERGDIAFNLAKCMQNESNHRQAIKWFERSISLNYSLDDSALGLARSLISKNRPDDAWNRLLARFEETGNSNSDIHILLSELALLLTKKVPPLQNYSEGGGLENTFSESINMENIVLEPYQSNVLSDVDLGFDLLENLEKIPEKESPSILLPERRIEIANEESSSYSQNQKQVNYADSMPSDEEIPSDLMKTKRVVPVPESVSTSDSGGSTPGGFWIHTQPMPMIGHPCCVTSENLENQISKMFQTPILWCWSTKPNSIPNGTSFSKLGLAIGLKQLRLKF